MSVSMKAIVAAAGASLVFGAAAQTDYRGMCDASAAVGLGKGRFVVADDEGDVLRIYQRGQPQAVGSVDLSDYLRNRKANGKTSEADLEGAARIGSRIYWISSHARKGDDASVDLHRHRFFATEIVAGTNAPFVKAVGEPYERLLDALLADARFSMLVAAAGLGPETGNGLNIEGLAATADGKLLIGFRNPRPAGKALVVPLLNPGPVVDSGAPPVFGDPAQLDLGGRGIRSMERVGNEILIAAGPHGSAEDSPIRPAFALFRWSAAPGQSPVLVRALDAGTQRAEAMFVDEDANELVILSDDGDEPVHDRKCKHKKVPIDEKSFRSRTIPLPVAGASNEPPRLRFRLALR